MTAKANAQPKKTIKFTRKPKAPMNELKRIAGLTKEQANKMNPADLFGKLPIELRIKILNPKETGIKVGTYPALTEKLTNELENILYNSYTTEGFYRGYYYWSWYDGGNFTEVANDYFRKKADQIEKYNYYNEINDLFKKYPVLLKMIQSSLKKYKDKTIFYILDSVVNVNTGLFNEDWLVNDDFDTNPDNFGLIINYDEEEYYTTNTFKRDNNARVKNQIEKYLKPELKEAKKVIKELEKVAIDCNLFD